MSERNAHLERAVFERRFADLLSEYATAADQPFDPITIGDGAARAAIRLAPWSRRIRLFRPSLRAAWVLVLLLGLMAALVAGAIALAPPPPAPPLPAFAPDELLLMNERDEIVAVTLSSGDRRVVSEGALMGISPDRTRLARVPQPWGAERHPVGGSSLIVTDARGRDLAQIPYGAAFAAWSPDGRYLAFNHRPVVGQPRGREYSVWDTATGAVTRLREPTYHPDLGSTPSWAPDSRHVLFTTGGGLVLSNLDGEVVQTIPGTDSDSFGYWSPDGAHILHEHVSRLYGEQGLLNGYLELLAVRPGLSTEVVSRFEPYITSPSWSPDGRMVAGTSVDGVTVVSVEDLSEFRVVYPREQLGRDWGVDVQWSNDGRRLMFGARDTVTKEWAIFGADAAGGEATVLLSVGRDPPPMYLPVDW